MTHMNVINQGTPYYILFHYWFSIICRFPFKSLRFHRKITSRYSQKIISKTMF